MLFEDVEFEERYFEILCPYCGKHGRRTQHHIVPQMYLRAMRGDGYLRLLRKERVDLCMDCHQRYERLADGFKVQLWIEVGGPSPNQDPYEHARQCRKVLSRPVLVQRWKDHFNQHMKVLQT